MARATPDSAETERLLEQVRRGDLTAFERLFSRYRSYIRQVVELRMDRRLRSRVDPSDVVQETQIEVLERLDDYLAQRPMPFRLWVRKTAHERLLNLRRTHTRTARRAVDREVPLPDRSSMELARQMLAGGSTPSQHVSRRELTRLVRRALAELSDGDREVLLMRIFEGLSYNDIGQVLGITPALARKRHGRALMRLHKTLEANGTTGSQL